MCEKNLIYTRLKLVGSFIQYIYYILLMPFMEFTLNCNFLIDIKNIFISEICGTDPGIWIVLTLNKKPR